MKNKISLSAVICTYGNRVHSCIELVEELLEQNSDFQIIISHQTPHDVTLTVASLSAVDMLKKRVNYYSTNSKGLAINRNFGIAKATNDYIWLLDDDIKCASNVTEILSNAIIKCNSAKVISFKMADIQSGEDLKTYDPVTKRHNIFSLLNVSSVETIISRKLFINHNLKFDERFGVGTNWPTGEENIFLSDCLKFTRDIYYYPSVICFHPKETSGQQLATPQMAEAKGAMFSRIFGRFALIICILFIIKKRKLVSPSLRLLNYLKLMSGGIQVERKL